MIEQIREEQRERERERECVCVCVCVCECMFAGFGIGLIKCLHLLFYPLQHCPLDRYLRVEKVLRGRRNRLTTPKVSFERERERERESESECVYVCWLWYWLN